MDALCLPSALTIRPICPEDAPRLARLLERCSAQMTDDRYFTPIQRPRPWTLQDQANVDHHRREAVVVGCADEIVGIAQYETLPARADEAGIAVLVEDAWQRRGLGTVVLARVSELASSRGVGQFGATVLGSNAAVLRLLRRLFVRLDVRAQGYTCDLHIALGAGRAGSAGAQFDRSAIDRARSMSAPLLAGPSGEATSRMYSSGASGSVPPVVRNTGARRRPMGSPGTVDLIVEPALVGLAAAPGRSRQRTPAETAFRCGHQLAQHGPDAARYCRAATWKPAFDSPSLLAGTTSETLGGC